jgi:O-antigen/teichoic acid export membrane protein
MGLLKQSLGSIAVQVAGLALGLGSGIVIARWLGPSAKGAVTLYVMLGSALATAGNLGMGAANVHLVGSGRIAAQRAWANSLWLSLAVGLGLAVTAFFAAPLAGLALKKPVDMSLLAVSLAGIPLAILFDCQANLLRGLQRVGAFNLAALARQALRLAALLAMVAWLGTGMSGALWSVNVSLALGSVAAAAMLRRERAISFLPSLTDLRRSLGYGLKAMPGQLLQFLNYRLDLFILAAFWDSGQVGLYATAAFAAEILWHVPNGVSIALFPAVSAEARPQQAAELSSRAMRHTVFWCLILAGGMAAVAGPLIAAVYGSAFAPSANALRVLLLGAVAMAPAKLALNHLAGTGRPQYLSYAAFIGLAVTTALDLALIPRWGMMGAAWASSAAYLAVSGAGLFWMRRHGRMRLRESLFIRTGDFGQYQRLLGP